MSCLYQKRLGTGTLPSTAHAQKEKGIPHTHVLRSAEPYPCSCRRPRPVMPVDNGACTSVARESDPVDQDGRSWLRKPWQHLFHERCDSSQGLLHTAPLLKDFIYKHGTSNAGISLYTRITVVVIRYGLFLVSES